MADFTLNLNSLKNDANDNNDEVNLRRCVYLVQSGEGSLEYLLKYGFSTDPSVVTTHKLRALKCIFSICTEEQLAKVTGKSVDFIKQHMKTLVYLSRLEMMNLPYTIQSLEQCSMTSLVESVWKVGKQTCEGVVLTRDLCTEYKIWSPNQWAAILDKMISMSMITDLTQTLIILNSQPHIWNLPQFLQAWNLVLQNPFMRIVPPANKEQKEECQQSIKLIHFCPTATDLKLDILGEI